MHFRAGRGGWHHGQAGLTPPTMQLTPLGTGLAQSPRLAPLSVSTWPLLQPKTVLRCSPPASCSHMTDTKEDKIGTAVYKNEVCALQFYLILFCSCHMHFDAFVGTVELSVGNDLDLENAILQN